MENSVTADTKKPAAVDETVDQTVPGTKWEFDENVTKAFADMLARSVPQYEVMRQTCYDLACEKAVEKTDIVDLGCSRGEAMA